MAGLAAVTVFWVRILCSTIS